MYCPQCRQERLGGARLCALCGSALLSRPRQALELELSHVDFVLDELKLWDVSSVPAGARRYLSERYERQRRILLAVLTESPESLQVAAVEPVVAPVVEPVVAPVAEPVVAAMEEPVEAPVAAPVGEPVLGDEPHPSPLPEEEEASTASDTEAPRPLPLPPVVSEPLFDVPAPQSVAARIVEETSTWDRVWRPFLYESIGWFLGAFLILSGTLYFVFESWAGMTSLTRSLVVFGMTAGYSAGFSAWGAVLARRESLRNPGRILGLIGSAVAPLAGVALGPVGALLPFGEALPSEGLHPALLVPVLLVWATAAAALARGPAEAFDASSRHFVQLALLGSTLMMGLGPLVARLGPAALWLDVLPCALFFLLSRRPVAEPRRGTALAFALGAPLYLLVLFAVRLHLALGAAGTPPALGTYAPLLAFVLATCLAFRDPEDERAADALSLGVVALQVTCLALAGTGEPPAFFLTAAVFTWTTYKLSLGGPLSRLGWLYGTYAGAYFAYGSSSQLLPGVVRSLLEALKARLGYPPSENLPFQFGALTAVPFVLGGVVLAARALSRGERTGEARPGALAEVLLRATAWASATFVLLGHLGPDSRPSFWAALILSQVCVGTGLYFERRYLSAVGAGLTLVLPLSAAALYGLGPASVVCGALALVLALLAALCSKPTRQLLSGAVGALVLAGFVMGLLGEAGVAPVCGLALCGASALLVTWALRSPRLVALAAFVAAAAVPRLAGDLSDAWVPGALGAVALVLALLGERGGLLRLVGAPGILYALLSLLWGLALQAPELNLYVLGSTVAVALASRTFPGVRPLAVLIASLALLPEMRGLLSFWPWLTPVQSTGLLILWGLGASLAAARWGRSTSTLTAGVVTLLYSVVPELVAQGPQPFPLLLGAALAVLLTARALPPSVSVIASTVLALMALSREPVALLALASLLSLLALLEPWAAARQALAGGRRFALAASLCAMAVLLGAVVQWKHAPVEWMLAGAVLLPLLWTRANSRPALAALAPLYVLLGLLVSLPPPAYAAALPLLALLLVRAAEHLPAFARLLLGREDEAARNELTGCMQGALMLVGLVLVPLSPESPARLCVLAASLALLPGPVPSVRLGLATGLLLFVPEARPVAAVLLLALGLLSHHRPEALWALLRCAPDALLRPVATLGALGLVTGGALASPTPGAIASVGGVLLVAAFLLSQRWLLTAATLALAAASLGQTQAHAWLEWRPSVDGAFLGVGLLAAALCALCQSEGVQRALTALAARLSPGLEGPWSEPLWLGGALCVAFPLWWRLAGWGADGLGPLGLGLGVLASLVLMAGREQWRAGVATGLLGAVLLVGVGPAWAPVVLAGAGLALCLAGTWLDRRALAVGVVLHHGGWLLALLSIPQLTDLEHPSTPLAFLLMAGCAWAVVHRRPEREAAGWLATLGVGHVLLMHLGAVYSTGRGSELILPYFGAVSAVVASVALLLPASAVRRWVGQGVASLALAEVLAALVWVDGTQGARREALVACTALGLLFIALVRHAVRGQDERSAFLAQGALALGYLGVRLLGLGVESPGALDSLVALVGGAVFSGLYVLALREGEGLAAFRRPALLGAFLWPLVGLLCAPWESPLYSAALLVGHAAHFAALATHPSRRALASLASVVAFNAALFILWRASGTEEPAYYVIPAGLSLLALLRVFRDVLEPDTQARLRALAVTLIYVAGAWRPLMFNDGRSMLLCVGVCLVGVAAGIALRIRSYVYLGSAFLVTCVLANLVRFGMRDHRVGAAFLSLLGLLVVGFMVLLSARREELLQRYQRVRTLLGTWEG